MVQPAAKRLVTEATGPTLFGARTKTGADSYRSTAALAMRPWHAALARAEYATATVVELGNSHTEITGASAHGRQSVCKLHEELRRRNPVAGIAGVRAGYSYISAYYNGTATGDPTSRAGSPGLDNTLGWAFKNAILNSTGKSVTFTATLTSAKVVYVQGGGVISVSVDGNAATNINTSGAANYFTVNQPANLTGLGGTSHTVTVAWVSGTTYLSGLMCFNGDESAGIHVYNAGHGGKTAVQFAASNSVYAGFAVLQPQLVTIELGHNDLFAVTGAAQFKTDLLTIIGKVRAQVTNPPSILLKAMHAPGTAGQTVVRATWLPFVAAMQEIAEADPLVGVLDLTQRFGDAAADSATRTALGLIGADFLHKTDPGHKLDGLLEAEAISPR